VGGHAGWDKRGGDYSAASWAVGDLWAAAGDGDLAGAVKSLSDWNNWSRGGDGRSWRRVRSRWGNGRS